MKMVGHNNHFMTFNIREMFGTAMIPFFDHTPCVVDMHNSVDDGTEQRIMSVDANGDEVESFV